MTKYRQDPSHKVVQSWRKCIPCTKEVIRGWERKHSLISAHQIGAEKKVEVVLWLPNPRKKNAPSFQKSNRREEKKWSLNMPGESIQQPPEGAHKATAPASLVTAAQRAVQLLNNIFSKCKVNFLTLRSTCAKWEEAAFARGAFLLPQISSNCVTSFPRFKTNVVKLGICIINISTWVPSGAAKRALLDWWQLVLLDSKHIWMNAWVKKASLKVH